jgi:hypothetical protein
MGFQTDKVGVLTEGFDTIEPWLRIQSSLLCNPFEQLSVKEKEYIE